MPGIQHGLCLQVPLTVAHRKGLVLDGTHPVLMKVYGAYGISLDTGFEVEGLPLLQRGWLLAFAHVRGGGELGRRCATSMRGAGAVCMRRWPAKLRNGVQVACCRATVTKAKLSHRSGGLHGLVDLKRLHQHGPGGPSRSKRWRAASGGSVEQVCCI